MNEPVLIIAFNRPDSLERLITALRAIRPTRVFVAIDGPRSTRPGEAALVERCRELVTAIDWPCEVQVNAQQTNLGCGLGVSTAITWFFEQVDRGIILEDDIIPDPSFFPFCSELLDRYEHDPRVFAISGCNYVPPSAQSHPDAAYRFSRVPHIWGWATWRRSWAKHRLEIAGWPRRLPPAELWRASGRSVLGAAYWASTFELLARHQVDTWDGQLVLASMIDHGLTATSNVNLVRNTGFGETATHTLRTPDYLRPVESITLPTNPIPVEVDERADAWTRRHHFGATLPGFLAQGTRYVSRRMRRSA